MTLHVNTITKNHIVSVSDRLIYTPNGYIEEADDKYKHFILITDDAKVVVTFAGFAGTIGEDNNLNESTIAWLEKIIMDTSHNGHRLWEDHIRDIKNEGEERTERLKNEYNISLDKLQLAIFITGEYKGDLFGFIIDNCVEKCDYPPFYRWGKTARSSFRTAYRNYSIEEPKSSYRVAFLGNEDLAMEQSDIREKLAEYADKEDINNIFKASVDLIRSASRKSNGSIGLNCSGVRISREDPGIQVFDDRENKEYDVMPDVIKSTSKFSGYTGGIKIFNKK